VTVQETLRRDVADLDSEIERLTAAIEDAERKIVNLRSHRDDARFRRAECLATADFLDNHGWKVERDVYGVVTVSVQPDTDATMTDSTPRTEAGRRLIGYLTPDALALVAEAEAQAHTDALDVDALFGAMADTENEVESQGIRFGLDASLSDYAEAVAIRYVAILAAKETP
jgi:hypothetical protein